MKRAALKKPSDYKCEQRKGDYMPLNLKRVLAIHNISQSEWLQGLGESNFKKGGTFSRAAGSLILNWNQWPKKISREEIQEKTEAFLRVNGVPENDLRDLWAIDKTHGGDIPTLTGRTSYEAHNLPKPNKLETKELPEAGAMLSQKAKKHFSLFRDPFTDDVAGPEDVFLSSEQRYIRESMLYAAKHGGFLAVIGESGAGKTTLRRDLIERISRENMPITIIQPSTIDKRRLHAGAICEAIVKDISTEKPATSLEGKARQVERLLRGSATAGNAHVLLIEEAHDLTIQVLKYLKRFWELEFGFKKLLGIILVGQPELKGMLNERINWEAREVIRRIEVAELLPLNGNLEEYVAMKFKRIGVDHTDLMDPDVYDAIHDRLTIRQRNSSQMISMAYPLVVNNTLVAAMNLAADIGADKLNADIVKEV